MWFINHFFIVGFIPLFLFMGERRHKAELKALGIRIRKIREASNLVQLDIEVKTGISRSDISKIENGLKNIEFITIVKIAEALDIEVFELFKPEK
jgi:DNA-binding XRE family transcriptional regulator